MKRMQCQCSPSESGRIRTLDLDGMHNRRMKKLITPTRQNQKNEVLPFLIEACRSRHADFDQVLLEINLSPELESELMRSRDPIEALYVYARHYSVFG